MGLVWSALGQKFRPLSSSETVFMDLISLGEHACRFSINVSTNVDGFQSSHYMIPFSPCPESWNVSGNANTALSQFCSLSTDMLQ